MNQPLSGIVPPIVTPLTPRQQLDVPALERQIERIVAGGVAGVFVCGTTGEAPSLDATLRQQVVSETCRCVAGRVPVLVGIAHTCQADSLALASAAARSGADAVVLTPPYYFQSSQDELASLARTVAAESPLPVFLYNIPTYTKVSFEPPTVRRLTEVAGIIGIKDSSGDLNTFRELCAIGRSRADWSVLVGAEHLLAEAALAGGHGGVTGGALLWPRLFVDLWEAARRGDHDQAAALHRQVLALGQLYRISSHSAGGLKAIKCALALLDVCDDRPVLPLAPLPESERDQVRAVLRGCGLLA